MGTEQNCTLDLKLDCVGQSSDALVALISPMSIEDRPLLWMVVSHRLIILSTYLLMGAGRLVTLLSWVLALFGPIDWRWGKVEV